MRYLAYAILLTSLGMIIGPATAQNDRRILVRGYELADDLQGGSAEQAFARGYILASLDAQSMCPPEGINAFALKDQIAEELLSFTDDELRLPASVVVVYPYIDVWRCPRSNTPGRQGDHVDLVGLLAGLKGMESNRLFAIGYIAGAVDGLLTGCNLRDEPSLDDVASAVREGLQLRLGNAEALPTVAKVSPLPAITQSLFEAGLCEE